MNGGLYCARQASSPVVIRLGAHTGGSVCLGLQPLHVVAAGTPTHPPTQLLRCESHLQGVCLWTNGLPSQGPEYSSASFLRTCSAVPTLSKAGAEQNWRSVFLLRLLEWFAERREDAGPRGGRRQTKHQGRLQTEVVEVRGGSFGGPPSPCLTDEKNRWYSAGGRATI